MSHRLSRKNTDGPLSSGIVNLDYERLPQELKNLDRENLQVFCQWETRLLN